MDQLERVKDVTMWNVVKQLLAVLKNVEKILLLWIVLNAWDHCMNLARPVSEGNKLKQVTNIIINYVELVRQCSYIVESDTYYW